MHDTFWLDKPGYLLRTQTSPIQIRAMKEFGVPIAGIAPGRVFRNEATDATHEMIFSQCEGLVVDKNVNFSELKGVLQAFLKAIFPEDLAIRFRPSFFPFTEPSAEVDVKWGSGWLEILGCGMVDPNVLKAVNIDPEEYTGFAFGLGVERIAMLKYGIKDIRLFNQNDLRFLRQL
jgi:phenylalanyl-tRNA synthetase alpha chain